MSGVATSGGQNGTPANTALTWIMARCGFTPPGSIRIPSSQLCRGSFLMKFFAPALRMNISVVGLVFTTCKTAKCWQVANSKTDHAKPSRWLFSTGIARRITSCAMATTATSTTITLMTMKTTVKTAMKTRLNLRRLPDCIGALSSSVA